MLNFVEMLNIYDRVGLHNYVFECLRSGNDAERAFAINTLRTLKCESDVLMFIAYGI